MKIKVIDYERDWVKYFEVLSQELSEVVCDNVISIEHVGSTSVVGLAAKPVIDIDIVTARENVPDVISALENFGYKHRGNLGIEDREAFYNPEGSEIDHHLYVCVEGTLALRNHLLLRDRLRSNPKEMMAYGRLKKELAAKYSDDIDSYIAGKTQFILAVLESLDFSESELSSIREPNMNSKRLTMKISYLSEYPHYVPEIAQWYYDEWGDLSSSTIESFVQYMEKRAASNLEIPLSFVAHVGDELVGAVELKFREHKKYPEYEHWLGSLYVDLKHRGSGVGAELINRTKSHSVRLNIEKLYLQCEPDLVSMYEKYGFQKLHKAKYGKLDTIIMVWDVR